MYIHKVNKQKLTKHLEEFYLLWRSPLSSLKFKGKHTWRFTFGINTTPKIIEICFEKQMSGVHYVELKVIQKNIASTWGRSGSKYTALSARTVNCFLHLYNGILVINVDLLTDQPWKDILEIKRSVLPNFARNKNT